MLAGNQFMPEVRLKQPGFTYCASGSFIKNKATTQNFKETGDSRYIYQSEQNKACFQHERFEDLPRTIASDKVLRNEAFNIANNPKYDGYQCGVASVAYNLF